MALFNHSNFTKPLKWLIIALCFKIIFYFLFIHFDHNQNRLSTGPFLKCDHDEYVRPIDNFFERGIYALDGKNEPYAGRLPGFVFPYIVFRAVFSEYTSNILLGIFILAFSILASYTLALLMFRLTQKRRAFVISFFLINCIPYFWHYDWTMHVNSLAGSCLIFFLYFIISFFRNPENHKHILYAGFFMAWLAMLRGFCLLWLPLALLYLVIILFREKKTFTYILKAAITFMLPMLIFESMWIIRNYYSFHKFIPLQTSFVPGSDSKNPEYNTGMVTKSSMMSVRKLIFAWGGDNTWYFYNADMSWFVKRENPLTKDFRFDDRIFFEGFTLDSLKSLRSSIAFSFENILPKKQQDSIENVITQTAERYRRKFVHHKPFYYYVVAPVKRLKNYLFKNPTQDWPGPVFDDGNIFQKTFKALSFIEYIFLLFIGLTFPVLHFLRRKRSNPPLLYGFIYLLVLANVFLFIFIILMSHYTYFIFSYILLIPILVFTPDLLTKKKIVNG